MERLVHIEGQLKLAVRKFVEVCRIDLGELDVVFDRCSVHEVVVSGDHTRRLG